MVHLGEPSVPWWGVGWGVSCCVGVGCFGRGGWCWSWWTAWGACGWFQFLVLPLIGRVGRGKQAGLQRRNRADEGQDCGGLVVDRPPELGDLLLGHRDASGSLAVLDSILPVISWTSGGRCRINLGARIDGTGAGVPPG